MNNYTGSMIAGFVATVVLSVLMLIKSSIGIMPELNVVQMLANYFNASIIVGWLIHFFVGVVLYGIGFTIMVKIAPRKNRVVLGILLALIFWIVMMVIMMPIMDKGMFAMGLGIGVKAAVATFILHIIFGLVLGYTAGKLIKDKPEHI